MSTEFEPLYIVFYGTLKNDAPRFKELGLDNHLSFVCDCEMKGDLYDVKTPTENFPAMVDGNGTVKGQLFEIRSFDFLPFADAYEEIDAQNPTQSLYLRKAIHLKKPDVDAWCYIYNQSVDGLTKINDGDWSAYLARKNTANTNIPTQPKKNFGT